MGSLFLGATLAGVAGGVLLSVNRQRHLDDELERVLAEGDDLVALPRPGDPSGPRVDPMAADPVSLEGIPPYPGASPRRLAGAPSFGGVPLRASWFTTTDDPAEVIEFYRQRFALLQRPNVSHLFSPTLGYAAFYEFPEADAGDAMAGSVHLVTVVKSGSQTYVFLSNSQPGRFLEQAAVLPGGLSLPKGALRAQWVEVGELPGQRRTLFTVVPSTSLPEVESHFSGTFEAAGWTRAAPERTGDSQVLKATQGDATVTIVMKVEGSNVRLLMNFDDRTPTPETP